MLKLAETSVKAVLEVLSMPVQYFRDITEEGVEAERKMACLVEQGQDCASSKSYRSARAALMTKMENEGAKQLANARIERASGNRGYSISGASAEK